MPISVELSLRAIAESILSSHPEERWLGRADFAVLRTLMLLAAVDGEISRGELDYFRSVIDKYRDDVGGRTRKSLWKSALHGAGYLVLQSRFLPRDELVAAFVEEAEGDFVEVLSIGTDDEVRTAFDLLKTMARSDGTLSDIEGACLEALVQRVSSERARICADRYPHGMIREQ